MGTLTACIYALLTLVGYSNQIIKIYRTGETKGIALPFFIVMWIAVGLRITTVGFIIRETRNFTAIALEIAELTVFLGLLIIACQVIYYRRKAKRARR